MMQIIHIETAATHHVMSLENVQLVSPSGFMALSSDHLSSRLVWLKDTVSTARSICESNISLAARRRVRLCAAVAQAPTGHQYAAGPEDH